MTFAGELAIRIRLRSIGCSNPFLALALGIIEAVSGLTPCRWRKADTPRNAADDRKVRIAAIRLWIKPNKEARGEERALTVRSTG